MRGVMKIRPETVDDVETVVAMHIRTWQAAYRGMFPDEVLDGLDQAEWVQRRLSIPWDDPSLHALVAEVDGQIAGFVRFGPERQGDGDGETGEIYAIYVDPAHWGTGVGDALLRIALETLPHKAIRLWVLEENARALRFYARHGLYPDGARATYTPRGSDFAAADIRLSLLRG
jgi:ribosomal protein S18 acetylase RimI-like enzyme